MGKPGDLGFIGGAGSNGVFVQRALGSRLVGFLRRLRLGTAIQVIDPENFILQLENVFTFDSNKKALREKFKAK